MKRVWMLLVLLLGWASMVQGQPLPPQFQENPIDRYVRIKMRPGNTIDQPHHHFDDEPAGDPYSLIQQRLADLEKKGKARKDLLDLYKQLQKDPDLVNRDPAVRKRVEELIKSSGMTLDPSDPRFKRLQEWLKNRPNGPKGPPLSPEAQEELKRLIDAFKNSGSNTTPPPDVPPPDVPEPGDLPPPPAPIDDAERNARREFTEWLLKQSRNLDNGRFRDSDLAKQIRNDLARFAGSGAFKDGKRWATDSKLGERFRDLTKDMRSLRIGDMKLPMPNISLPRGAIPNLPNLGGWGRPPSINGGLPGIGTPSMPSAPGTPSGEFFVWLIALGVVGLIAWRLYKLYGPVGAGKGKVSLADLPWPTAPGAVATRADLVRAFEFLSIALLGRASRTWNHLDVAAKLGGEEAVRREAAGTLAALYEQARYAPGDEPLAPDAFSAAQRSLTLLSGGAA